MSKCLLFYRESRKDRTKSIREQFRQQICLLEMFVQNSDFEFHSSPLQIESGYKFSQGAFNLISHYEHVAVSELSRLGRNKKMFVNLSKLNINIHVCDTDTIINTGSQQFEDEYNKVLNESYAIRKRIKRTVNL